MVDVSNTQSSSLNGILRFDVSQTDRSSACFVVDDVYRRWLVLETVLWPNISWGFRCRFPLDSFPDIPVGARYSEFKPAKYINLTSNCPVLFRWSRFWITSESSSWWYGFLLHRSKTSQIVTANDHASDWLVKIFISHAIHRIGKSWETLEFALIMWWYSSAYLEYGRTLKTICLVVEAYAGLQTAMSAIFMVPSASTRQLRAARSLCTNPKDSK